MGADRRSGRGGAARGPSPRRGVEPPAPEADLSASNVARTVSSPCVLATIQRRSSGLYASSVCASGSTNQRCRHPRAHRSHLLRNGRCDPCWADPSHIQSGSVKKATLESPACAHGPSRPDPGPARPRRSAARARRGSTIHRGRLAGRASGRTGKGPVRWTSAHAHAAMLAVGSQLARRR